MERNDPDGTEVLLRRKAKINPRRLGTLGGDTYRLVDRPTERGSRKSSERKVTTEWKT